MTWLTHLTVLYTHTCRSYLVNAIVNAADQLEQHVPVMPLPVLAWVVIQTASSNAQLYWIPILFAFQVSGLPTNQAFLKRLAAHPAFVAAEVDTSFIQKHHASLVDCPPLPRHVTALIAIADHLLQIQQVSAEWPCRSCDQMPGCCKGEGAVQYGALSIPCACLFIFLPSCLSVCLSVHPSVRLHVYLSLSVCLSVALHVCLSTYTFVCPCNHLQPSNSCWLQAQMVASPLQGAWGILDSKRFNHALTKSGLLDYPASQSQIAYSLTLNSLQTFTVHVGTLSRTSHTKLCFVHWPQ